METLQQLINSFSVEQLGLAFGVLSLLLHSILNRGGRLTKPINLFIVRAQVLVLPFLVAVATDPHVSALVHAYLPSLLGYFTAYQGGYQLFRVVAEKWANLKALMPEESQAAEQLAE